MKRVAARPPTVPTTVTTVISHLKRATALNTRRQSTPVSGWANPWPNPMSAPMGGAAAGATAGSEEPACRGRGLVLIGTRTSTVVAGRAGCAVNAPSLWQVRYRAARSPPSPHAANRCTVPGGRMHLGAGATPRYNHVTHGIRCRCAENRCRCGLATGWPEPCVGGSQPEIEDAPMSIPLAQDGVPPSVEGREASAMLASGPGPKARRRGAFDYLPKPFSASHLQVLIGRAVHTLLVARETREQRDTLDQLQVHSDKITLLGTAPSFRRAIELARKVAPTDASVFITGESGSGKEMIAQFIHHHSRRSSRPFIAVNCAALPEGLLESEMFGHRKGAFTGAVRDKPGLLEAANGGTLFLDELIEMPKPIQAKLLRVIQDGVVRRVGSETTDAVVNVRFIAATNGDPESSVESGDMREDLYYRLKVVPIHVPALRERPEDIPLLADYFLSTYWVRHRRKGAPFPRLTDAALRTLCGHPWRGNVRELQNVIEHVAVVEPGAEIRPEDLQLSGEPTPTAGSNPASLISTLLEESYHAARDRVIAQFERQYLTWLVNRASGNMIALLEQR